MKSANPVLTRLGPASAERATTNLARFRTADEPMILPGAGPVAPPVVRPMTVDDVVVRTVALLALTGVAGALAWVLVPLARVPGPLIGATMIGLVLGIVIALARVTNPVVIGAYAVVEGVFVGLLSKVFENWYPGIAIQAAVGAFGVCFLMAMLYKSRVIRATPKFIRGVVGATFGVLAVILLNLVLSLFGVQTGLRGGGLLSIVFSLVVIVIAALNFILDFALVEEGVRQGLPERYAWACAFGLLVTLVWMYVEILRLLGYLRGSD